MSRFDIEPFRSPDKWFEDAHDVGLGLDLELHAIEKALVCMKKFPKEIKFSVNCCPELIMSGRLESLTKYGPDLSRVVLEITEHAAIENYDMLAGALSSLRAKGLCLAVDDVGAGYASMRHILNLKPEIIKLDISITQSIDKDKFRRALAKGLISFSSEIGSFIVAEGIESYSEFNALKILGVDFGQNYYLAKPLSLLDAQKFTAQDFPIE